MKRQSARKMRPMLPVPWTDVRITGGFWEPRLRTNREKTLAVQHAQCAKTGRIFAFGLTGSQAAASPPHHFWDSDVAKWIEASAYSIGTHPDARLERWVDEAIDLIASAQLPDGYLNLYFGKIAPEKRWTNLRDMHELYCAGHLMEAAVAYFQATGKRRLLDVLCRYADHIDGQFGPRRGQRRGVPGHPEIELALMKLHDVTADDRYRKLATFFIHERGRRPNYFDVERGERSKKLPKLHYDYAARFDHYSAHESIESMQSVNGHAVRALYLLAGAADAAAATGSASLRSACRRLWLNVTQRRMYLTGGVGSRRFAETFTFDYDLPNETAYAETCAAIALALFSHRMLRLDPRGEYGDVLERTLYNGILSGVSLGGDQFFYANPLAVGAEALGPSVDENCRGRRQTWFGCACCPPNLARLLASLGGYLFATRGDTVFVHLFAASTLNTTIADQPVRLSVQTEYPWDPTIQIMVAVSRPRAFAIAVRLPGWCDDPSLKVNGRALPMKPITRAGYATIRRVWSDGDVIELMLPMPPRRVYANPKCRNDLGKVAIQRGPIVYCVEDVDHAGGVDPLVLPVNAPLRASWKKDLLGGVCVIGADGESVDPDGWNDNLYRHHPPKKRSARLVFVPYSVWGNRRPGGMRVWIAER